MVTQLADRRNGYVLLILYTTSTKTVMQCIMHTIKITVNLLFEYQCSLQAANLSDCRIESKLFLPELECSTTDAGV